MKLWIPISILALAVIGICVWDNIYTNKIFDTLIDKSDYIFETVQTTSISDENLKNEIINLNKFWTEKMDILSISISRKDLQPVSDYLQYLHSSLNNNNQEDAITYSRLLNYNIHGLKEVSGISIINLL